MMRSFLAQRINRARTVAAMIFPWWQVRHCARAGGAISSIVFFYGSARNVLTRPAASRIELASGGAVTHRRPARLAIREASADRVAVTAAGLMAADTGSPKVSYRATFEYHTGYLRQRWEYDFGDGVRGVRRFLVRRWDVRPELDEFLARRLDRWTERGRAVFPGPPAFVERSYARYLCLCGPSVRQWQSQLGQPGHARYAVTGTPDGDASLVLEPWNDPQQPIQLKSKKMFEWFMGLANIRRQLDRRYFIARLSIWHPPSEQTIRELAEHGVNTVFFESGVVPGSYEAHDPDRAEQIVRLAHKYGMRIYPFDAHVLLSRRTDAVSAEQRAPWATERLGAGGRREPWGYSS